MTKMTFATETEFEFVSEQRHRDGAATFKYTTPHCGWDITLDAEFRKVASGSVPERMLWDARQRLLGTESLWQLKRYSTKPWPMAYAYAHQGNKMYVITPGDTAGDVFTAVDSVGNLVAGDPAGLWRARLLVHDIGFEVRRRDRDAQPIAVAGYCHGSFSTPDDFLFNLETNEKDVLGVGNVTSSVREVAVVGIDTTGAELVLTPQRSVGPKERARLLALLKDFLHAGEAASRYPVPAQV